MENEEKFELEAVYGEPKTLTNRFVSNQRQIKKVRFLDDVLLEQCCQGDGTVRKPIKSYDDDELSKLLISVMSDKETPVQWKKCWHTLKRLEPSRKWYNAKTK